jgi:uroporphyrinogen III methyltransferase/synthase
MEIVSRDNREALLKGKTILVTRASGQADELIELIQRFGGTPLHFPTIHIVPPDSWEECDAAIMTASFLQVLMQCGISSSGFNNGKQQ